MMCCREEHQNKMQEVLQHTLAARGSSLLWPWSVRTDWGWLQCSWTDNRAEKYLMPTAVHTSADLHLTPLSVFRVTACGLFFNKQLPERGPVPNHFTHSALDWLRMTQKTRLKQRKRATKRGKLRETLPSLGKWYAGFAPFPNVFWGEELAWKKKRRSLPGPFSLPPQHAKTTTH